MANQTSAGVLSALLRVAMRVTIVFLALVMLVVGFFAFLMAADKYHWGWTEASIHYRFSFGVEVGDVAYTGATVVQIAYTEVPRWQAWAWIDAPAGGAVSSGEPAAVRLPGGKVLCLMVQGGIVDGKKEHHNSLRLTSLLLGPLDPSRGGRAILHSSDLKHLVPSAEIPLSMLPTMLIFDDFNNPKSAHIFDPQRPDQWLGPGAKFLGAQIEVTSEPRSVQISKVLPWLNEADLPIKLTDTQDPFYVESGHGFLFKGNFGRPQ